MKTIQNDTNSIILPSDKGNTTMVMDKLECQKVASLVVDGSYSKLKMDLRPEMKLLQILNKNTDYYTLNNYRQHYTKLPSMYSLLKNNKVVIPLRSIISCRGSACYLLIRFLGRYSQHTNRNVLIIH